MTGNARATTCVTAPDGFLGTALVKALIACGHRILAPTRSVGAAVTARRTGAAPVMGDLLTPLHLSPQPVDHGRIVLKRAAGHDTSRQVLDANLLDAVTAEEWTRSSHTSDYAGPAFGSSFPRSNTDARTF